MITEADAVVADDLAGQIRSAIKEMEAHFNDDIAKAHALHKSLTAKRRVFSDPLNAALKLIKGKIGKWQQEELRKAREAEERERKAREAEVERQRLEEAVRLEAAGRTEEAEKTFDAALTTTLPVAKSQTKKPAMKHAQTRKTLTVRVVNPEALAEWAMEKGEFNRVFQVNSSAVRALVKELGDVPGVEWEEVLR